MAVILLLWIVQLAVISSATSDGGPVTRWNAYWRLRAMYRPALAVVDGVAHGAADVADQDALRPDGSTFHPLSRDGATRAFVAASGLYAMAGATMLLLIASIGLKRRS